MNPRFPVLLVCAIVLFTAACNGESRSREVVVAADSLTPPQGPLGGVSVVENVIDSQSLVTAHDDNANTGTGIESLSFNSPSDRTRFPFPEKFERVWYRDASIDDPLLMQPSKISVAGTTLILSDLNAKRIVALDLRHGKELWSFGRAGDGPGEFRGRTNIVGRNHDTVMLWNSDMKRLTRVGTDGRLVSTLKVTVPASAHTLCVLGDGTMLLSKFIVQEVGLIAHVSADGNEILKLDSIPWHETRRLPPLASQSLTYSLEDGSCMLAASYWAGVVRLNESAEITDSLRLIEHVPLPSASVRHVIIQPGLYPETGPVPRPAINSSIDEGVSTTGDLTAVSGYFVLAFGGSTAMKGRLLDFYDRATGQYAGSLTTVGRVKTIAGSGDTFAIITEDDIGLYRLDVYKRIARNKP